jgi:hypothetical protein
MNGGFLTMPGQLPGEVRQLRRWKMEFNIRPIAKACARTGKLFQPGETCWSALIEKDGRLVREDYSTDAWQGPPEGAIGYWKSVIAGTTENARPKLDADSLFDYFVQLSDSPNVVQQQYRYVLALLLLRKRRLILEEAIVVDDHPTMRLIGSAGEGPFDVPEQELSEEQIRRLQQQLFESGRNAA